MTPHLGLDKFFHIVIIIVTIVNNNHYNYLGAGTHWPAAPWAAASFWTKVLVPSRAMLGNKKRARYNTFRSYEKHQVYKTEIKNLQTVSFQRSHIAAEATYRVHRGGLPRIDMFDPSNVLVFTVQSACWGHGFNVLDFMKSKTMV